MKRAAVRRDPTAERALKGTTFAGTGTADSVQFALILLAAEGLCRKDARRLTGLTPRARRQRMGRVQRIIAFMAEADGAGPAALEDLPESARLALREFERSMLRACQECRRPAIQPMTTAGGRPARYCSPACKQRAYRARRKQAEAAI
ncbi:hypothetical protein [Kitasatospora sp. NPDC059571]|uniref:hypothetical protein n=1 Tax=Kitasatospora sp. NPDC059571 TaxID=3346871 RepID=UPI0036B8A0A1